MGAPHSLGASESFILSPKVSAQRPDFYLGDSEGSPPNWGGHIRSCWISGRPQLATGRRAWRVRVEPPLGDLRGGRLSEVVLTEHAAGDDLARPAHGWVQVNVCAAAPGVDIRQERFGDRQLRILYWAEAARDPAELPEAPDYRAEWRRTLARIKRFVADHGHSRVPEPYRDVEGRLDIIVESLRWHHAGRGGTDPCPFPGIDYARDLDQLPGWDWTLETED